MGDDLTDPALREAVEQAATTSGADHVIATLPHGLHTLLDKRFDGAKNSPADNGNGWRQHAGSTGTPLC